MKSQIENAWDAGTERLAWTEERGLKSQIENARQERKGRGRWTEEGGLKSQIERRVDGGGRVDIAD